MSSLRDDGRDVGRGAGAHPRARAAALVALLAAVTAACPGGSAPRGTGRGATAGGRDAAQSLAAALRAEGASVAGVAELRFASNLDRWRSTGLVVERGQGITVFGFGGLAAEDRTLGPRDLLWLRIGDGEAFGVGSDTDSLEAPRAGELELAVRPPGIRWQDCRGAFPEEPDEASQALEGLDVHAVVAAWRVPVAEGLGALSDLPPGAAALADWQAKPRLPAGFQPLCHLPDARVFQAFREGGRVGIRGLATGSAGIVKKPLDLPLGPDTELSFDWRYETLPALGPETDPRHHDYSSLALELDNGQDLTWMWASEHLEPGTWFRCPLRWWDQRETHFVLDSGRQGLGEWRSHRRNVAEDYRRAVGGELPSRIVGVWFISVGAFGGGAADATFVDVRIRTGGELVEVFD